MNANLTPLPYIIAASLMNIIIILIIVFCSKKTSIKFWNWVAIPLFAILPPLMYMNMNNSVYNQRASGTSYYLLAVILATLYSNRKAAIFFTLLYDGMIVIVAHDKKSFWEKTHFLQLVFFSLFFLMIRCQIEVVLKKYFLSVEDSKESSKSHQLADYFSTVLNLIKTPIMLSTSLGKILFVNDSASELLEIPVHKLLKKGMGLIVSKSTQIGDHRVYHTLRDGAVLILDIHVSSFEFDDKSYLIVEMVDETSRLKLQSNQGDIINTISETNLGLYRVSSTGKVNEILNQSHNVGAPIVSEGDDLSSVYQINQEINNAVEANQSTIIIPKVLNERKIEEDDIKEGESKSKFVEMIINPSNRGDGAMVAIRDFSQKINKKAFNETMELQKKEGVDSMIKFFLLNMNSYIHVLLQIMDDFRFSYKSLLTVLKVEAPELFLQAKVCEVNFGDETQQEPCEFFKALMDLEEIMSDLDQQNDLQSDLMTTLLTLERVNSGSFELEKSWFHFSSISQSLEEYISQHDMGKKVRFEVENDTDIEESEVFGDMKRLEQVCRIFVSNSLEFTPSNGVITLKVTVLDKFSDGGCIVQMRVIDSWKGMNRKSRQEFLVPYSQILSTHLKEDGGIRLRLSLCKEIAMKHGGDVGIFQRNEIFCNVRMEMRNKFFTPTSDLPSDWEDDDSSLNEESDISDYRILMVEDSKVSRKRDVHFLNRVGYKNVDIAVDGKEAVMNVRNKKLKGKRRYDLIFMDKEVFEIVLKVECVFGVFRCR